jgi:hypothetical protein
LVKVVTVEYACHQHQEKSLGVLPKDMPNTLPAGVVGGRSLDIPDLIDPADNHEYPSTTRQASTDIQVLRALTGPEDHT